MRRYAAALAVAVLVAPSSTAFAAPSAADKETARALLHDADAAFASGDAGRALKGYAAADAIMQVPTTGIEVAKAEAALQQLVEARETCLAVTRIPETPGEPKVFASARARCQQTADDLAARIPSLTLSVVGLPAGVTPVVEIDGAALPSAALLFPRKVNPGAHTVTARAPGYRDVTQQVVVAEKASATTTLTFVASPPPLASATTAPTPPPVLPPPALPGDARSGAVPTYGWIALGAAGVGVVAGSVTGILSLSQASSAKKLCNGDSCPSAAQSDISAATTTAHVSDVAFGCAIAAGAVATYAIVTGRSHAPTSGLTWRLRVAGSGAVVDGTF